MGAYKTVIGGTYDATIAKFDATGAALLWSTYYGTTSDDYGIAVAIDLSDNIYVTGQYYSSGNHTFVAKFNSLGNARIWSNSYVGDFVQAITLDANNDAYITGLTPEELGIATAGAYQTEYAGGNYDAFVAKFNAAGTLVWGTYYGGEAADWSYAIRVDASNNVYIAGHTPSSIGIATNGSYQTDFAGGTDAYVACFNSSGDALLWATYYGGAGGDAAYAIALDANNYVYIAGTTSSASNIATSTAYQSALGGSNIFVAKISSDGSSRVWGTYYGGTAGGFGWGFGITLDISNNIYITGTATSSSNIATNGVFQTAFGGLYDAFVAKFDSSGSSLLWGTFYGGPGDDRSFAIALDANNNVYIAGVTTSTSQIATAGAYKTAYAGGVGSDVFVAKFTQNIILPIELLSFTGKNQGASNLLEWTTATEINQ